MLYDTTAPLLTPTYATNPPFNAPQETRAFDVDGDGDLDLAEVYFADGRADIYLNRDGVLDTQPAWRFDASQVGTSLDFGDLNNDGLADLVVSYTGDPSLRVFLAIETGVADTTGDGLTRGADLVALLAAFGSRTSDGVAGGDINGDARVTGEDPVALLSEFGCGA